MNLYCYVGNNPVNRVDPEGKKWVFVKDKGWEWQFEEGDDIRDVWLKKPQTKGWTMICLRVGTVGNDAVGHSWIAILDRDGKTFDTYGTWNDSDNKCGNSSCKNDNGGKVGLNKNREKVYNWNIWAERCWVISQTDLLNKLLPAILQEKRDTWDLKHNCADFTTSVIYETVGAWYGGSVFETPSSVRDEMKKANEGEVSNFDSTFQEFKDKINVEGPKEISDSK